jgi:hypothetical protein
MGLTFQVRTWLIPLGLYLIAGMLCVLVAKLMLFVVLEARKLCARLQIFICDVLRWGCTRAHRSAPLVEQLQYCSSRPDRWRIRRANRTYRQFVAVQ